MEAEGVSREDAPTLPPSEEGLGNSEGSRHEHAAGGDLLPKAVPDNPANSDRAAGGDWSAVSSKPGEAGQLPEDEPSLESDSAAELAGADSPAPVDEEGTDALTVAASPVPPPGRVEIGDLADHCSKQYTQRNCELRGQ